jgi:TRAP-type mannitol/chloroaromatic compound transport system substrate-binding protein
VAVGIGAAVVFAAIGLGSSFRTASPPREAAPTAVDNWFNIQGENSFGSGDRRTSALQAFAKTLSDASSGRFRFEIRTSGSAFKSLQSLDDQGFSGFGVDAVWAPAVALYGRNPAFALVGEPPFGPDPARYVQWRRDPKVKAIVDELYQSIGKVGLLCGVTGPNADLWSRRKLDRPADLKDLQTRTVGVMTDILGAAGLSTRALPAGEIYPALSSGVVDAIQLSDVPLGVAIGLPNVTKNLYFPGSLAPTSGIELIFGTLSWEGLGDDGRGAVEGACQRNVDQMLAAGEAENRNALTSIGGKGVMVATLPAPVLAELRTAWIKVAADKSSDPLFARLFALTGSPE